MQQGGRAIFILLLTLCETQEGVGNVDDADMEACMPVPYDDIISYHIISSKVKHIDKIRKRC